jgi:hypothetical protein
VLVDHGRDAGIEQRGVRLCRLDADAGAPGREGREPQQHHGAHHFVLDGRSRPGSVTANQAALKLNTAVGGDVPRCQRAEPGRDAIVRLRVVGERLDDGAALRDELERLRSQLHGRATTRNGEDIGEGEGGGPDHDARHGVH